MFDLYLKYFSLHYVSKLDVFLAKLLLVYLIPSLVVLDEHVNGVS